MASRISKQFSVVALEDAVVYEIVPTVESVIIPTDQTSVTFSCTASFYKRVGQGTRTAYSCYYAVYGRKSDGTYQKMVTGGATTSRTMSFTVSTSHLAVAMFIFNSSYTGTSPMSQAYLAKTEIPVLKNGDTGPQGQTVVGHTGRFYYYAGEYSTPYSQYQMEETQAPYVSITTGSIKQFWMLDFKGVEPSSIPAAATDSPSSSSSCWTLMSSDQQYYIAKAFFGDYAQFGSSIINGDFLMSQYVIAKGFEKNIKYINDGTKYTYVEADDVMGEKTFYDQSTHPSYFPLDWYASSSSNYIHVSSTSYSSSSQTNSFSLTWGGLMYTVEIEYYSTKDLEWKLATLASGTAITSGTIPKRYSEDGVFYKYSFFIQLDSATSTKKLFFRLTSSNSDYADISSIIIRRVKYVPIMCIDMLSGKMVINNIVARGELHADSLFFNRVHSNSNNDVLLMTDESMVTLGKMAVGSTVILPAPSAENNGHVIEIFNGQNNYDQSGNAGLWYLSYVGFNSSSTSNNKICWPFAAGSGAGYGTVGTPVTLPSGSLWNASYRISMQNSTYVKMICQQLGDSYVWLMLKREDTNVISVRVKGESSDRYLNVISNPFVGDART